jgi:hypothetical protein
MSKIYFREGVATFGNILNVIKDSIMLGFDLPDVNNWEVTYSTSDILVMKIHTEIGDKEAYIKFKRNSVGSVHSCIINITYGDGWDDTLKEIIKESPISSWTLGVNSFYGIATTERTDSMEVDYWISVTNNRVAIGTKTDPSLDFSAYNNQFVYFGRIVPFNDTDIDGNIALTVGTRYSPHGGISAIPIADARYGMYSSSAMIDISMLKNKSGMYFQSHYPSMLNAYGTIDDTIQAEVNLAPNKFFFQASAWTKKYHATPVYVVHPYDGYRGYLEDVIAIAPESLIDTDILQENVGTEQAPIYQRYKIIDINLNDSVNFINRSNSNPNMIIAIRKQ